MNFITVVTSSADNTHELGTFFGSIIQDGDIFGLNGEIGSGKTTFTQGIAEGLGIQPYNVNSPTFSLIAEHLGGRIPLYHVDFYRLSDADSLEDLAFDDYLDGTGALVVEWADKISDALPQDHIEISFQNLTEDSRQLSIRSGGPRSYVLYEQFASFYKQCDT